MNKLVKHTVFNLMLLGLMSCSPNPEISALEGYWEIEKVDFPDGNTKEYNISTTVDHYKLESDSTGYKVKVNPQLDGSFLTSGDREAFTVEHEKGDLLLHFTTSLSEHTEKVIQLKENTLIMMNDREMKYTYKRFEKLELE